LAIVLGAMVLILSIVFLVMWIGFHQSAVSCTAWGHQNGFTTRFIHYNWFDRGCVARVQGGHWLPIQQIRGVQPS